MTRQVIVTSSREAASAVPRLIGGAEGVDWTGVTDWTPYAGRRVAVWPSNSPFDLQDAADVCAALHAAGADPTSLKLISPPENDGADWDLAIALADGWDRDRTIAYAREHATVWTPPPAPPENVVQITSRRPRPSGDTPPTGPRIQQGSVVALPKPDPRQNWMAAMVMDDHGKPKPKLLANHIEATTKHEFLAGVFRKNLFTGAIELARCPPWSDPDKFRISESSDADIPALRIALERLNLTPTTSDAKSAILRAATDNQYDPARDWLESLKWDGIRRVQGGEGVLPWLTEYCGADRTPLNRAFGMRWLIGGVARVLHEGHAGVKVDTMLILEGAQGKRKSSALAALGTWGGLRLFTDSVHDITNKDALMQIRGNVIVEIAEMNAMDRASVKAVKGWLTTQVDRYRAPYGSQMENHPRRCIVAGTVNPGGLGYLRDPTGARRFWPVAVTDIDLVTLTEDVPQLWAEAVHLYKQGEQWWLTDEEVDLAEPEQANRYLEDPWAEGIDTVLRNGKVGPLTVRSIAVELGIPVHLQTTHTQERIANHLHHRGYEASRSDGGGVTEFRRVK